MSKTFNVGDMVIAVDGWIGQVIAVRSSGSEIKVRRVGRVNAGSRIRVQDTFDAFWIEAKNFDKYQIKDFEVVKICAVRDDNRVVKAIAYNKDDIKIGEAAFCCPSDTWDFNFGINTMVSRLKDAVARNAEAAKFLNTKVICIKNDSVAFSDCYTVGKIYTVTDGVIKCNHEKNPFLKSNRESVYQFSSIAELNKIYMREGIQFLEIVED